MLKKIIRNISYITLAFCIMFANFYVPKVEARTLADIKAELEKFERDYHNKQLEKEISEKEKKQIQDNIAAINDRIDQANKDIIASNAEIDRLNEEIERLNEEIAKDEAEIQSILAFVQAQNGESAYLEYAFGAQDFTDFIYRIAVSEQLTTYNDELIEESKRNIEENKRKMEELENKKVELEQKKTNLANEQKQLKVEMDKIAVTISEIGENMLSITEEIKVRKADIERYEKMGCNLNEDINACLIRNEDVLPSDTQMWRPLQTGYVTGWYGWRVHPIYNTKKFHYGMDMSNYGANAGNTPVYAVANGQVAEVLTPYSSCGGVRVYIVHNINGKVYTSGYWHMNKSYVKKGDIVTKDTVIGTIAGYPDPVYGKSDGCSNGAHLHLEISTGVWADGSYSSNRLAANSVINFPTTTYNPWSNRTKRF